jgi:SAM-dependent methyltransferase
MQVVADLAGRPYGELRVLDVACGEGVYAIEAALRGAQVLAVDARTDRMDQGREIAQRLGLGRLEFRQEDLRRISVDTHGTFDVVLFLGILYHLDEKDVFRAVKDLHGMTGRLLVIDTQITLQGEKVVTEAGVGYEGRSWREHADDDPQSAKDVRTFASLDNPWSFLFTRESLFRLLREVGFTSVLEVRAPLEPFKPADRITVVAVKGNPVHVSTYPWVEGRSEAEIERFLARAREEAGARVAPESRSIRGWVKAIAAVAFGAVGLEVRRRRERR